MENDNDNNDVLVPKKMAVRQWRNDSYNTNTKSLFVYIGNSKY
jgi:hypothetical protein